MIAKTYKKTAIQNFNRQKAKPQNNGSFLFL